MLNSDLVSYHIGYAQIENIADITSDTGLKYTFFNVREISFIGLNKFPDETKEDYAIRSKEFYDTILADSNQTPDYRAQMDVFTERLKVEQLKTVYAVSTNGLTDWKFIVDSAELKDIVNTIIPSSIREKQAMASKN